VPTAPYSSIRSVNASGSALAVLEDEGAKFTAPFTALVWSNNDPPQAGNNTHLLVTDVTDDTLTFITTDSFHLVPGQMIAETQRAPTYPLRSGVTVSHDFEADDRPYILYLRSPQGELAQYGSVLGVQDDGNGVAFFSFDPDKAGEWKYRFASATQQGPDSSFFAMHSDVLD
jgi:hypothetical protein